ncbi:MAG: hypothetical protein K2N73_14880 [Lachnospiraceae bacterium]|nr:hypothetical protein [Lachnospiraceae bacterium]
MRHSLRGFAIERFYQISQKNRYKLDVDRKELQMLVSDVRCRSFMKQWRMWFNKSSFTV